MKFKEDYTLAEVKAMLSIYEGNRAIKENNSLSHRLTRQDAAAHAQSKHAGVNFLNLGKRVNTIGGPRNNRTYLNQSSQASATMEILNSVEGKKARLSVYNGAPSANIETELNGRYQIANAEDLSIGSLVRKNPGRKTAGFKSTMPFATHGFVKIVKAVGGLIQIQTSYPTVN